MTGKINRTASPEVRVPQLFQQRSTQVKELVLLKVLVRIRVFRMEIIRCLPI